MYNIRKIKLFTEVEEAGTNITYRCRKCRCCKVCKDHERIEEISIREEVEQELIKNSVDVDVTRRSTVASLPFMQDPKNKLAPNKEIALKVYHQQVRKLNKNVQDHVRLSHLRLNFKHLNMSITLKILQRNSNKCSTTMKSKTSSHGEQFGKVHQLQHHAD